jgi:putative drug exporter of the RND superfamily
MLPSGSAPPVPTDGLTQLRSTERTAPPTGVLAAIGRWSAEHRFVVVVLWLVLVAGAAAAGRGMGGGFVNDMSLAGTDSQAAYDTMRAQFPDRAGDGLQVVLHADTPLRTPEVSAAIDDAVARLAGDPDVAEVAEPFDPSRPMVSKDGTTAIAQVQFTNRAKDIPPEAVDRVQAAFEPLSDVGLRVEYAGSALQAESGPSGSEVIGLAAAVIVLLIAFGSVFAMVVPLITALLALGLGLSVLELVANGLTIATAGPVVAAMIGLGVGIDYALLIVTRHREGLAEGLDPVDSIALAMSTAGRAVLVAGVTVVVAVLGLLAVGIPFVSGLGIASAITVSGTLLAAVTLLPALLAVFGRHLDRYQVRRPRRALKRGVGRSSTGEPSGWGRWTTALQRHPWLSATSAIVVLLFLATPLLSLRLGTADGGSQPTDTTQRRAYDLVSAGFGPGWTGPLLVTATYDGGATEPAAQLRQSLSTVPGVIAVAPPQVSPDGSTAVLTVIPSTSPDDEATEDLVHRLRGQVLPAAPGSPQAHVGGATATSIDLADRLGDRMPWFMLLVVGLAFMVLVVEFRSLLVPLMAVSLNLLAVGAAYGPVVAVFQWGWWPASLFGASAGPVESFAPVMLFAVLFGLSTDYAVFVLSRVREAWAAGADPRTAVRAGLARTGRVVAAAGSVMVVVFGSFVLNDERVVNLFGFGLAVAVALYVGVAMLVFLPATLSIVGRAAWWFPGKSAERPRTHEAS